MGTDTHVALIRGINVGHARRVAMADLRALVEGLGYGHVRTLLNSGNVLFSAPGVASSDAAARITVLTAAELAGAVADNSLLGVADDPSRMMVAVLANSADRMRLEPLLARNLKAEIDPDRIEAYRGVVSLPFPPGDHRRIAVKIVDDRGIESLKILEVE